ncbi:MAG: hypothetical protein AABX02_05500 [archaeon]
MQFERKSVIVGVSLFLFTLAWGYFLGQTGVTPDSLLHAIADVRALSGLLSIPLAATGFFLALSLGIITAYADRDERTRVYVTTIVPTIVACGISALLFPTFAAWYPLALFFFGAIPFMLETARIKRLELVNFPIVRSSYSGAHRGLQIVGVGILVTLALVAAPQSAALYTTFQDSLFGGKVLQQLDIQKISGDFMITTQRDTLTQVTESAAFSKLRDKEDADVVSFVTLMDQTLVNVSSQEYKDKINQQIEDQANQIDPSTLASQIQKTVPGYEGLKQNFWLLAAFVGTLFFFLFSTFFIQPLAAILDRLRIRLFPWMEALLLNPLPHLRFQPNLHPLNHRIPLNLRCR